MTLNEQILQKIVSHYLATPLLQDPMVFPPSRERLPSGNMWTQPPLFNLERAKSIPCRRDGLVEI